MSRDTVKPQDSIGAALIRRGAEDEQLSIEGRYDITCYGADGKVKWTDVIENIVVTVGKNDLLNKYLAGAAYTQTLRMGLKGTGTAIAADTQASHASWLEVGLANAPAYTGNRQAVVMGAAASGVSTGGALSFVFTSGGTVAGCFINNGGSATKDDTTGVLFSAGDFTGGNRAVLSGDTIVVTYTLTIT